MKTKLTILLVVGMALTGTVVKAQNNAVLLQNAPPNEEKAPKIEYVDAVVDTVIKDLANQANINVVFDPKVAETLVRPDGKTNTVSIKWMNITARQALVTVLDNYGYMAEIDPDNPVVVRIKVRDPNALEPLVAKILPVRHGLATNMVTLIKPTLGARSQILPDSRSSQLVVVATESEHAAVSNILKQLDLPTPQILIESKFVETSKNPKTVKGIDWTGTLENQTIYFGNGITAGSTITKVPGDPVTVSGSPLPSGASGVSSSYTPKYSSSTLMETAFGTAAQTAGAAGGGLSLDTARGWFPHTAFLTADGAKVALSFLNTDSDTEFIASPRAVTLEGQEAELSVIRNVPVFEEQQGVNVGGAVNPNTVKPNYQLEVKGTVLNEVGIKLVVNPRVVGNSDISMDLKPEISTLEGVSRVTLGGRVSESPIFRRQKLYTRATVPTGNTLVLGGLVSDETTKGNTKVPILGDIPGFGLLFRKDSKERRKSNLLIFVTPSIVVDGDFQPTTSDFLKTKPMEKPDVEETAWDTGKPASKYRPLF